MKTANDNRTLIDQLRASLEMERALRPRVPPITNFQKLVTLTNQVAFKFNGSRDTCILTSFALHDVLQRLGYNSRPLRIEAAVFPDDRKLCGTILGSTGDGGRRPAAAPDMWHGHLGVIVGNAWLLDATLDQANKSEWPRAIYVGPMAVRLTDKFWTRYGSIMVQANGCSVRFSPYPKQIGFANAGDARPSHWKPLADRIFRAVQWDGTPRPRANSPAAKRSILRSRLLQEADE